MKWIVVVLAAAFVAVQAFRPVKNTSGDAPGPNDIIVKHSPPADVAQMLKGACYDCHSNNTRYPRYAEVQPLGWWLAHHVDEGKAELNFSEFGSYPLKRQLHKLNEVAEQVADRGMPLRSYTWMHRDARLTDQQVAALSAWADELHDELESGISRGE